MGCGGKCLVAVQRRQGRARRGARAIEGRAAAHGLGENRQGHRHDPQGRVRIARGVEQAHFDRGAQPLVRSRDRGQPAAGAQGQANQAPLRHPGEKPAADLRRVRQPHRRAAGELPSLPGQRAAARPQARSGPAAARLSWPRQSLRPRPIRQSLLFADYPGSGGTTAEHVRPLEEQGVTDDARDIIDWEYFEKSRAELGPGFIRILSYFKEDGTKSIAQIEQAMREENTTALVIPAHTLKGEARQLGAEPLAKIAELIETTARFCMESRRFPDELVPEVVQLRKLFDETVELFTKATNPLVSRTGGTGLG